MWLVLRIPKEKLGGGGHRNEQYCSQSERGSREAATDCGFFENKLWAIQFSEKLNSQFVDYDFQVFTYHDGYKSQKIKNPVKIYRTGNQNVEGIIDPEYHNIFLDLIPNSYSEIRVSY
jgi:hypothetical protein